MQPNATASVQNSTHVGSNGLRYKHFNETDWLNWNTLRADGYTVDNETVALTMAIPYGQGERYGSMLEGWFIPPATTAYRFYLACDDYCQLEMNNETFGNDTYSPIIAHNTGYMDHRDWYEGRYSSNGFERISAWINLTKGEPYYMKATHLEGSGGDHFTAGVEIE